MDFWIVGLLLTGCLGLVVTVLLLLPVNLNISLQARGEPDGMYAAAGGAKVGPVTGTFVVASQAPFSMEMRLFGWPIKREQRTVPELAEVPRLFKGKLDAAEVLSFVLQERRRIAFKMLDIDLSYSFRNVARTGQLLACLVASSALLPASVRLRQTPSWELENRLQLAIDGQIKIWLGRLMLDSLRFGMHMFMLKRRALASSTHTLEAARKP